MHPKHRDALTKKAETLSSRINRAEQRIAEMEAENEAPEPLCTCVGCVGYEKPPKRYGAPEFWRERSGLTRLRQEQRALYDERQRLGLPELERLWAVAEWDYDIEAEHEAWQYFVSWI